MSFEVSADAYDAFMGRFSEPLAGEFLAFAGAVPDGARALDVGCGPGALTRRLVEAVGVGRVSAVDPSSSFLAAARRRFPELDVHAATAESLPFEDAVFGTALAQLVVHFMRDPVLGLGEMARVTRPGGTLAACVWDHADQGGPLSGYWSAVRDLDPTADDESHLPGTHEGDLARLATEAGWQDVAAGTVGVTVGFATFEEWWAPYTLGVGPAGAYVTGLDDDGRRRLREHCAELLPAAPFTVRATAWAVRGRAA